MNFINAVSTENKFECMKKNISPRQWDILFLIEEMKINTVSLISKELDLSLSSLSIIISKMVGNNLVEKNYEEDNSDGRIVILDLSKNAKTYYYEMKKLITTAIYDFINSLDEESHTLFTNAVEELEFIARILNLNVFDIAMNIESQAEVIYQNIMRLKFVCEKLFRKVNSGMDNFIFEKGLAILAATIKDDLHTPSQLSQKIKTSESTISTQLKALINKNLMYKTKKAGDSRKTYFYATEEGISIYDKCIENTMSTFKNLLSNLDKDLLLNLDNGLDNLIILFEVLLKNNLHKEI